MTELPALDRLREMCAVAVPDMEASAVAYYDQAVAMVDDYMVDSGFRRLSGMSPDEIDAVAAAVFVLLDMNDRQVDLRRVCDVMLAAASSAIQAF